MNEPAKKYAVYSAQQARLYRVFEYQTPAGTTVLCTEVSPFPGAPNSTWTDKIDLGEVVSYVRTITQAERNPYELS
jgi:hypothetical protein